MTAWFTKKRSGLPEFLNVPWSVRDVLVFVLGWIAIQVVILLLLAALKPVIPGLADFLRASQDGDLGALFVLNLLDAVVGLGLIALYLRRYHVGWSMLGWRRANLGRAVLWLAGILVVFVALANVLLWLVGVLDPSFNANEPQQNEFLGAKGPDQSLALIALVVLPPIVEETVFRGFMFPALSKRMGVVWGAIFSSIVFGLAHGQANIAVYTIPLGLLLCLMYVRLGSIVPGVALHMINNYLAYAASTGASK